MKKSIVTSGFLLVFICSNVLLAKPDAGSASRPASGFWITKYGAVGDGKTLCTEAINKAIDAAAQAGGGTVYVPAGTWLSGTIFLKSNVTLHLEPGCTISGTTDIEQYPERIPAIRSFTDNYTRRSLIYAEDQDNIAIEGAGTINGNGGQFPRAHGLPVDYVRPFLIRMINCRDVRVEGIFMTNSAHWNQHYLACERVRIIGVRVHNFSNYNNDGMDIDGCKDVVVSKCFFNAHDDTITLKGTSEHPCQNVLISDCVASSCASGIKMGTETVSGFKDITITNCTVRRVGRDTKSFASVGGGLTAIELIIVDGGHMEQISVSNIVTEGYRVPLGVRLGDRGRGFDTLEGGTPEAYSPQIRRPVGSIKDISFSNITATEAGRNCGIMLLGHPGHPLENISLSNITIRNAGGGKAELADRQVPERAHDYPQAAWWGDMPAYGLYARHVRGLTVSNVRLQTVEPDARHALVLDDVQDVDLNGVAGMPAVGDNAVIRLIQTQNVLIRGCRPRSAEGAFVKIDGKDCSDIALTGNDFARVRQVMELAGQAPVDAIRQNGNVAPVYTGAAIVSQPVSQFVGIGDTAEFTIRAGNATAYQWYKRTGDSDKRIATHTTSAQTDTLRLTNIKTDDEGTYYCVVKNNHGDDTSTMVELQLKKLIGHWKFDSNANDASGLGHHGTVHGGAEFVDTVTYKALKFDGKDDYVQIPAEALARLDDEISIALWQYGAASQPRRDFIFHAKRKDNRLGFECHLPYSDGKVYWYTGDNSDRLEKAASESEYKDGWHQWCFVKDAAAGTMAIYLDGRLWASRSGAFSKGFSSDVTQFAIGTSLERDGQPDGPYAGMIRDVRIYNYALSDDKIARLYSEGT
jgi:hypothetical protein